MSERIVFAATLPAIQSALTVSGEGSARVKLDVPASDLAPALRLLTLTGQVMKITVEPMLD